MISRRRKFRAGLALLAPVALLACNESLDLLAPELPKVAYADTLFTARVGDTLRLQPASTGGRVFAWRVSPALPAGLALDSLQGIVSGVPSDTSSALHRVIAKGAGGNDTATLRLVVTP